MSFYQSVMSGASGASAIAFFRKFERTKLYDFLAASPLIAWYLFALGMQLPRITHQIVTINLGTADAHTLAGLASNIATQVFTLVLTLLMVIRRQPLGKASGFYPRFAAVAGTFLSISIVVLPPRDLPSWALVVSTLMIVGGIAYALYAVLSLGRSLSMLPEARRLVTSGPYNMIRHPVYLGEAFALAGVTIQFVSYWALAMFVLQCVFQLERMRYEELVLSRAFPEYKDYAAHTARLVPGVY
jgi:protein-S-isoprenylcysteine O-methyltransferase Ste14